MDAVDVKFAPATGTDQEWNEAYGRLADYFRAYRLHNRLRRTELVLEALRRAAETHAKDPRRNPSSTLWSMRVRCSVSGSMASTAI
jgi:hypothetical protein